MQASVRTPAFPPVASARAKRDRERLERSRAVGLIPHDEAPLTKQNLKAIRDAERHAAPAAALRLRQQAGKHITRQERETALAGLREARRVMNTIEVDVCSRTEERYIGRVLAEITALETDRGETVMLEEVVRPSFRRTEAGGVALVNGRAVLDMPKAKRLRITTRDGLEILANKTPAEMRRGDVPITQLAYAAGLRFRELYEKADPERSLRPPNYADPIVSGGGGEGREDKRKEIADQVAGIVKAVRAEARRQKADPDLWSRVLQEVVGKGVPILRCVTGSRARARWRAAIDEVLDVVADRFGMQ